MPRSVLIFGNPGAGKSTLLNVMLGGPRFRSGLSPGHGLTQELACVEHDGVQYFDVPGLNDADLRLRKRAAEATTTALQQAGDECTVFFVLTWEAGRIKQDDMVTIRAVLLASLDIRSYGVIINKLTPRALRMVQESPSCLMDKAMEIIPPTRRTTHFHYQMHVAAFMDEEGSRIDFGAHVEEFADLRRFISTGVPPCSIRPGDVTPVDALSFDQLRTNYEALKQETAKIAEALKNEGEKARVAEARATAAEQETAKATEWGKQQEAKLKASEDARKREADQRLQREREERAQREREENAQRQSGASVIGRLKQGVELGVTVLQFVERGQRIHAQARRSGQVHSGGFKSCDSAPGGEGGCAAGASSDGEGAPGPGGCPDDDSSSGTSDEPGDEDGSGPGGGPGSEGGCAAGASSDNEGGCAKGGCRDDESSSGPSGEPGDEEDGSGPPGGKGGCAAGASSDEEGGSAKGGRPGVTGGSVWGGFPSVAGGTEWSPAWGSSLLWGGLRDDAGSSAWGGFPGLAAGAHLR